MKIQGRFIALLLIICISIMPIKVWASEQTIEKKEIVRFEEFDINANALKLDFNEKPSLLDLKTMMPKTLEVYLKNGVTTETIEVDWFCVGADYEDSAYYYYQFSPMWDEEHYYLNKDIDLLTQAPYIAVFLTDSRGGMSTFSVTNNSNESIIYNYLTEIAGYSTAQACGIMANLYCESGFISTNLENYYEPILGYTDATYTEAVDNGTYTNFVNDSAGYGLCQWTYYTRKQGLLDCAKENETSIGDIHMQLCYFSEEFVDSSAEIYVKTAENTANGAYDAAYYFCEIFENPWQESDEVSKYRGNLARNTYWTEYGPQEQPEIPFTDVTQEKWYYNAVKWAYDNGVLTGTSDTTFAPNDPMTRGMLVMVLYRMEDRPQVSTNNCFPDVNTQKYYASAITWASEQKIVSGYSNGKFGPEDSITREQLAKVLYLYADYKGYDVTAKESLSAFNDASNVSSYAKKYMQWAVAEGLIKGSNGKLKPKGEATRAEIAAILKRFVERYERLSVK